MTYFLVFKVCVYLHVGVQEEAKGVQSPGVVLQVFDCECWDLNSGPWQEQYMLSTARVSNFIITSTCTHSIRLETSANTHQLSLQMHEFHICNIYTYILW